MAHGTAVVLVRTWRLLIVNFREDAVPLSQDQQDQLRGLELVWTSGSASRYRDAATIDRHGCGRVPKPRGNLSSSRAMGGEAVQSALRALRKKLKVTNDGRPNVLGRNADHFAGAWV